MINSICTTCGTEFAANPAPPDRCAICEDERQYRGWSGQEWTTLEALAVTHRNAVREEAPGLTGIGVEPAFAIGQRALHIDTPRGGILWDCVPLVTEAAVTALQAAGPVTAIAVSHPHFYSGMIAWSRALGGVPVYVHADDRRWVMRPDPAIVYWRGDHLELAPGATLIRCGGHFDGGAVLHWAAGAGGAGALLTGDVIQVCQDRRSVSFMYSYPNLIPINAAAVRRIVSAVTPYPFEQFYGAWWGKNILADARESLRRSASRYIRAISP